MSVDPILNLLTQAACLETCVKGGKIVRESNPSNHKSKEFAEVVKLVTDSFKAAKKTKIDLPKETAHKAFDNTMVRYHKIKKQGDKLAAMVKDTTKTHNSNGASFLEEAIKELSLAYLHFTKPR